MSTNDVSYYVRRCNLKDFTNTCHRTCETVQLLQDFFSAMAESWCFRRLLRVRIEIDDFIFFTTDLKTMNYYSTIHC